MADEENMPDDEQLEEAVSLEEMRANMQEAREVFTFLSDFGGNSTWVATNNMQRRVARTRVLCMEILLHGVREIHSRTVQAMPGPSSQS
jgi:hypothetical protein